MKAGILFWKLFGAIGASLIGTLVLGGLLIAIGVQQHPRTPPVHLKVLVATELAAAILTRDGPAAAESFLKGWRFTDTAAILDGRCVTEAAAASCGIDDAPLSERREAIHDGVRHEIVVVAHDPGTWFDLPPLADPVLVGVPISLLASLLLTRHIVTPIRVLGSSVRRIAEGRFDVRVAQSMPSRRDEIGDLGRDVDSMAIRLERMTLGQRRLFHDVSHELRSPLFRLRAAAALARRVPARREEMLSRFEREIERMDGLVDEILTLSRFDAGTEPARREPVDPAALIESILVDADFEARQKSVEIRRSIEHGTTCLGVPELLRRGLENIVRNALKFSPSGHFVDIAVRRDADGGRLCVTIRDEGPGMSEEELVSAFEPFYRGSTSTPSHRGYGLGLSIAKRAVDCASGEISVSNNRSAAGVTVTVRMPVAPEGAVS